MGRCAQTGPDVREPRRGRLSTGRSSNTAEVSSTNKPAMLAVSLLALGLILATIGVVAVAPTRYAAASTTTISAGAVSVNLPMPLQADLAASASGCTNAPGPTITLSGVMALGGLDVQLTFQNNVDGTHQYTSNDPVTANVIPSGDPISIPKQPVDGGVGGNPWIWFMFTDPSGNAMTSPVFLGRCVQGLKGVDAPLVLPATATADIMGGTCSNKGSTISLSGQLSLSGLDGMLMFANSDNPVGGPHQANVMSAMSVTLIPAGDSITFAKQPSLGGVGGNPWIYLDFTDPAGMFPDPPMLLGRCVQNF